MITNRWKLITASLTLIGIIGYSTLNARTFLQYFQMVSQSVHTVLGTADRTGLDVIMPKIDKSLNFPFRMYATAPTADSKLNISGNAVEMGNETIRTTPPIDDVLNTFVDSTIDYQTGATTGGTIQIDGATFSLPGCSVGYYRHHVFHYISSENKIDSSLSSENATLANIKDVSATSVGLGGIYLGHILLECTGAGGQYKTATSTTSVIENKIGSENVIFTQSGAGSGGGGGGTELKAQSISGSVLTIKGGSIILDDGRVLTTYDGAGTAATDYDVDITVNLDTILTTSPALNTTYNLVIDLEQCCSNPANLDTIDDGRQVYPIGNEAVFKLFTTALTALDKVRYVPIAFFHSDSTSPVWSGGDSSFGDHPRRRHDKPISNSNPTVYTLTEQTIGTVGSIGQIAGGHSLTSDSFTSTPAALSWWNLEVDANDDSTNGRNLTTGGGFTFTATDLFGNTNNAADCSGTANANSTNAALITQAGGTSFTAFTWFNPDAFGNGRVLSSSSGTSAAEPNGFGWGVQLTSTALLFNLSEDGTDLDFRPSVTHADSGVAIGNWSHVAVVYDSSNQIARIYIDGIERASINTPGLTLAETTTFYLCTDGLTDFDGQITQAGYEKRVFTSEEIRKLASYKISHNKNVATSDQNWLANFNGVLDNQLDSGWLMDTSVNAAYVDFSDLASTDSVKLRLQDTGSYAKGLNSQRVFSTGLLSVDPGTTIVHGLPDRPNAIWIEHEGHVFASRFTLLQAKDYCDSDATNLYCDFSGLTIDGTHRLKIVAGVGADPVEVPEATTTRSGIVNIGDQSFAGNKTFSSSVTVSGDAYVLQNLGVGTSSPDGTTHIFSGSAGTVTAHVNADDLVVENSGLGGVSILTPDANPSIIYFGSPSDNIGASINWTYDSSAFVIETSKSGATMAFKTGASVTAMTILGDGKTELSVRTDGDCGIGNICGHSATSISSIYLGIENVTSVSATGSVQLSRIGPNVIISGKGTLDPTASARTRVAIDLATLPSSFVPGSNFGGSENQAGGVAQYKGNSGGTSSSCTIESRAGTKHLILDCRDMVDEGDHAFTFTGQYTLQ